MISKRNTYRIFCSAAPC